MQMTHNCIFYTPQTFSSCPFLTSCLQAIITWINLNDNKSHIVLISSEDHLHKVYWPHTPALIQLRWLPVLQRIKYKNLFLKAVSDSAQTSFSRTASSSHALRAFCSASAVLRTSHFRPNTVDARAFSCAAPHLWSLLPLHLRQLDSLSQSYQP